MYALSQTGSLSAVAVALGPMDSQAPFRQTRSCIAPSSWTRFQIARVLAQQPTASEALVRTRGWQRHTFPWPLYKRGRAGILFLQDPCGQAP